MVGNVESQFVEYFVLFSIDDARNLNFFGVSYMFYIGGKGPGSPLHLNSGNNVTSKL